MIPFSLDVMLLPGAKFEKGREEDAGYDLFSMVDAYFPPLTKMIFPVGIRTAFPPDWVGLIGDRSSRGCKEGLKYLGGIIDSGYRGEWGVALVNLGGITITIESILKNPKAKAIAQVIFVPRGKVEPNFVLSLPESSRGEAWDGSTNK